MKNKWLFLTALAALVTLNPSPSGATQDSSQDRYQFRVTVDLISLNVTVVDTLTEYCPGLKESILHRQVVTPWDMEQEFGLTEGNIFQGELSLEQLLFQRPAAGWSRYRTPVKNLWMCGSGTHPGGGIMGSSGQLAAKAILEAGEL